MTIRRGADTRRVAIAVALIALIALCIPPGANANPAVDEYSLNLPDAKGKVENPAQAPVANTSSLPRNVVSRLRKNPSGNLLATIATAGALGAPAGAGGKVGTAGVAGEQPSALSAVGGALGDPAVLGLVVLLALAGGAWIVTSTLRSRRGQ